jgi:hypothetical protein
MNTVALNVPAANNAAWRYVLLGGFFSGLADFIYPTVKTVMAGGPWFQPWKGVAYGLVGQAARDGGTEMAVLGAALHFFICISAAFILYAVVKNVKFLPRHWVPLAIIHGLAVLLVMNYVIVPLSKIGIVLYPLATLYISAFWHIVLVGIPTGFFVARALREGARQTLR